MGKPIAAIGTPVGENPLSKIDVADSLQNAEKKIEKEKKNKKKHKPAVPYKGIAAKATEKRLNQVKEAIDWWDGTYSDKNQQIRNTAGELLSPVKDLETVVEWWANEGKLYDGPKNKEKKAIVIRDILEKIGKSEDDLEMTAKKLRETMSWWKDSGIKHRKDLINFDSKVDKFTKVKQMFDTWKHKELPSIKKIKFDPIKEQKKADQMGKEIKKAMANLFEQDESKIEGKNLEFSIDPCKKIKAAMANWKYESSFDLTGKQFEKALEWWAKTASSYDSVKATKNEQKMYNTTQQLFKIWGFNKLAKEVGSENRAKEIGKAIKFWRKNKNSDLSAMDPVDAENIRKVDRSMLQVRANMKTDEFEKVKKEIEESLKWWKKNGKGFKESSGSSSDLKKFNKLKQLLSEWSLDDKGNEMKASKDMEDAISWWDTKTEKGLDSSLYDGENLKTFNKV